MFKYSFLLLSICCLVSFKTISQVTCEQILSKKDDILIKSNKNTSELIEELERENDWRLQRFDMLKIHLLTRRVDVKELEKWKNKADSVIEKSALIINDLLEELNAIAQLADNTNTDYVLRSGYERRAKTLLPLNSINNWDDRTIPTKRLIGNDINYPKPENIHIEERLREYRNEVLRVLANYSDNQMTYFYTPAKGNKQSNNDMASVNPIDKYHLNKIHEILSLNEVTYLIDEQTNATKTIPWIVDNFVYSSILETAVIINQLVLKVKLIEKEALDLLLNKIDAPRFYYNQISTFQTLVDNSSNGDFTLKFVIAAVDSTANYEYRYSFDKDIPKENWKEGKNNLVLSKDELNDNNIIYGESKVFEKGRAIWIPWEYKLNCR